LTCILTRFKRRRIGKKLCQPREPCLESTGLQILFVHHFAPGTPEELRVRSDEPVVIAVAGTTLEACLTDSTPDSSHWLMLRRARELHLIHGVFFAKELSAVTTIDLAICRT